LQRFLSGSKAQENGAVSDSLGGMQVADVNMSTSLRMKNLGNVPPRFETLRRDQVS
jgi:hypothetical protein